MLARLRLVTMLIVALGLLASFAVAIPASAEVAEQPASSEPVTVDSDADGALDAPDTASATAAARTTDAPVEDLSQRTETESVVVNPDGTLTSKKFATPVRIKQDGEWVDVDYTLTKKSDGSWAPKAAPVDVSINGGSDKEAARVTFDDGESLAVTWPTDLPEPTVNGGVATYELSPASDLVLAVTSSGVNAHLQLNQEPATDDPVFSFSLRAEGVDLDQTPSGGLEISGDDGKTIARTSTLIAWDASTDYAGDPANVVELDATLDETTTSGDVTQHTLDLTTPDRFLSDPDTQYPVTIDPDIGMTRTRDTWVRSGDTTDRGSAHNLIVGKINPSVSSNSNPARSYLKFHHGTIENNPNVDVISAELGLYQYYGHSCTDRRMYAYPVATNWNDNITYANVPPVVGGGYSTYVDENRGATGCADGWTTMNVTNMAKAWNTGAVDMQGLRLHAGTEDMSAFERRFCSMNPVSATNCNTPSRAPYLSVTYVTVASVQSAIQRLTAGTGTPADRDLIVSAGLGDVIPDGSQDDTEVEAVDEDDVSSEPLSPEEEAGVVADEPSSDDPDCDVTSDIGCSEGVTTLDTTEPIEPEEEEPTFETAATEISQCKSGHRARRYTVSVTQKSLLGFTIYKWSHRVHYCTKSGKVTKWRGRYDFVAKKDSTLKIRERTLNVSTAPPATSVYSRMQRHLQQCVVKYGCYADHYPWSKLTVNGSGGKSYKRGK